MIFDEAMRPPDLSDLGSWGKAIPLIRIPFRHPHHTVSAVGLAGGANLAPGEISLAHNGVLFWMNCPSFTAVSLRCRQPMEDHMVTPSPGRQDK